VYTENVRNMTYPVSHSRDARIEGAIRLEFTGENNGRHLNIDRSRLVVQCFNPACEARTNYDEKEHAIR
jgi:hypothetical protein